MQRLISLVMILLSLSAFADSDIEYSADSDSLSAAHPSLLPAITPDSNPSLSSVDADTNRNWWHLLKKNKLDLKDSTVQYPRFVKLCVDIYNWADKAFNSYDPEYVEGTGKRWKARIISDNWSDYYAMHLNKDMSMRMLSDLTSNLGPYVQYMAVSVGYSANLNHLISHNPVANKRMDFGFNCARFNLELYYLQNTGGTQLRQFNSYKGKKLFKSFFPGVDLYTFGLDIYYFFNNKKYSQGAAYNFSKIQKRSAGSFMLGFSYSNQDISLDFSTLDSEILKYYTLSTYFLKFHYNNYCVLFGYGHNFVLNPHLLFNVSLMPSAGVNHCYEDSAEGSSTMFSFNVKGRVSMTYNLKNFFAGISSKIDGHLYNTSHYSLFNAIMTLSASAGIRF